MCIFIISYDGALTHSGLVWYAPESDFTGSAQEFNPSHELDNCTFKITASSQGPMICVVESTLFRCQACCLFVVKPIPDPVLTYWLDPWEQTNFSKIWIKYRNFLCKNLSAKCQSFCSGLKCVDASVTHHCRADSRIAPSQSETPLQSNAFTHWLGANLESAMPLDRAVSCYLIDTNFWYTGGNLTSDESWSFWYLEENILQRKCIWKSAHQM